MREVVRRHWRCGVAVLVAASLAFLAGRGFAPEPRVELREVERVRVQVVESVRIVEVKVRDESTRARRVVERTRVEHPDGTKIEHEVERAEVATTSSEASSSSTDRQAAAQLEASRETAIKVDPARPQWRAGALVGLELLELRLVVGGLVERRILGPVSVGAWGLSSGSAGLAVTVEF